MDTFLIFAPCSVEGCTSKAKSRGLCSKHYQRWAKYGSTAAGATGHGVPLKWLEDNVGYQGGDCLLWPFAKSASGYGHVQHNGKITNASRVMCLMAHGVPQTPDHQAAHSCGNGHLGCVNPKHLRWATQSDNQVDAVFHGVSRATIHPSDVVEARRLFRSGLAYREIGKRIGASETIVRFIMNRRTWSYVDQDGSRSSMGA